MARKSEMTKEDRKEFLEMLKQSDWTIFTRVEGVARSGMTRWIDCFVMNDNRPLNINWYIEKLGTFKRDRKHYDALKTGGCGMDMGFQMVYVTSGDLFRGHESDFTGETTNPGTKDAGYFLQQRWF